MVVAVNPVQFGTSGNDTLAGSNVNGLGGDDRITGTGTSNHLTGGSGNDFIIAGAGDNYLLGDNAKSVGGTHGNDSFAFKASALAATADGQVHNTIFDFGGAGGYQAGGDNDFIAFTGFTKGGTVTLAYDSTQVAGLSYYTVHNNATGVDAMLAVTSTNGKHLVLGDYNFYA